MCTSRQIPRGAAVVALVAMLAGCAGAGQVPSSGTGQYPNTATAPFDGVMPAQPGVAAPRGEALNASQVSFEKAGCGPVRVGANIHYVVNFATRGTASGPRPGTFEAHGLWAVDRPVRGIGSWKFVENFTISSGVTHVAGAIVSGGRDGNRPPNSPEPKMSCFGFGPAGLEYRLGSGGGAAQVGSIKLTDFDETLQGL